MPRTPDGHWPQLLLAYRRRQGWSQAVLAERLGVDQTTISRWERRLDVPGLKARRRIRDLTWSGDGSRGDQAIRMRVRNSLWPSTLVGRGAIFLEANHAAVVEAGLAAQDLRGRSIYGAFGSHTDEVTEQWEAAGIFQGDLALAMSINVLSGGRTQPAIHIRTLDTPHFTGDGQIWCLCEVKRIDEQQYRRLFADFGGNTMLLPFDEV